MKDGLLVSPASVAADSEQLEAYKHKPILTLEERIASVAGCRYVDEVLVLPCADYFIDRAWIELHDIDLVVHGDDLTQKQIEYYYKVPIELGIFRKLPYTRGISTTDIIHRITGGGVQDRDALSNNDRKDADCSRYSVILTTRSPSATSARR